MPSATRASLDQIRHDLQFPETRVNAAQALLLRCTNEPSIHPQALELFRSVLQSDPDPTAAMMAARGLDITATPAESRDAWRKLLHHPRADMVARAALHITDPAFVPILIEILNARPEPPIQSSIIRILSRLKDPAAYPHLIDALGKPDLRPDAIDSLSDFSDPRAIPYLEPFLRDSTPTSQTDDRGYPLDISHLANAAILHLRRPPAPNLNSATAPGRLAPPVAPPQLPPLNLAASPFPQSQTANQSPRISLRPPILPSVPAPFHRLIPFIPLGIAILELPFVALILFFQLFLTGKISRNPHATHFLDFICALPPSGGVLAGLYIASRPTRRPKLHYVLILIGCLACSVYLYSFGWEFFD